MYFQMPFLERKVLYFDSNLIKVCSLGFQRQQVSFGSCDDLILKMWQTII